MMFTLSVGGTQLSPLDVYRACFGGILLPICDLLFILLL